MNAQQWAPHKPKPAIRRFTWLFWLALGIVIIITLALIVLIIWLATTQDLDKLYTKLGIVASVVAIVTTPLIFFFAVVKRPETRVPKEEQNSHPPLSPEKPLALWNVPYPRNPYFTGREDVLQQLYDTFTTSKAHIVILSGLGGSGKTQTAVEYAYRYHQDYQAILWINATSYETLITGFTTVADMFDLPAKQEKDRRLIVAAVKQWLTSNDHWLLMLDNADDLPLVYPFLPVGRNGYILLTSQAQAVGAFAQSISMKNMLDQEGSLFLLRRAKRLAPDTPLEQASQNDQAKADAIVKTLGGLPLALDQAGAYIEETRCSLSDYEKLYQTRHQTLLSWHSTLTPNYPRSVATTLALALQKVAQINRAAVELLELCAFLAPDAIPEDIITEGASFLGPVLEPIASDPLRWNAVVQTVQRYSLIERNIESQTLTIHRLIQMLLKSRMRPRQQRQWAERAVQALSATFPNSDYTTWTQCQQYLPHALMCASYIEQWHIESQAAAQLLGKTASYLHDSAQYPQAEPLYQRAITIDEKALGPEHPQLATHLHNLAGLYRDQGKYPQAEPLYQRAITIDEKTLGPEHPTTVIIRETYESFREDMEEKKKREENPGG